MEDPILPHPPPSTNNTTTTPLQILCCLCATPILPNSSNTCASCLASQSDITHGISTENTLHQCRACSRWYKSSNKWIACDLESRDLLSLCLGNISGLKNNKNNSRRLVDASWIWTEPHSMRLKVRLTIQKEVTPGTILQQSFVVSFIVRHQQCVECQAEFRQGSWKNLVQVRQHVGHKRTFLYLEQLILKHGAHRGCLSIQTYRDGMDFYFPDKGKAGRFMSFLESVVPIKMKTSKKLISTDVKSNIANFKHTALVEIPPICKDDLLLLPPKTARSLGNISRLVLVKNITSLIHLIDPLTGQTGTLSGDAYWRDPLRPIVTAARGRFSRFVVWGKEPVVLRQNASKRQTSKRNKKKLARVTMVREDDLGVSDEVPLEENSHVGYLMKSGDVAVGYDMRELALVGEEGEELRRGDGGVLMPDVILLRKLYGVNAAGADEDAQENNHAARQRIWKLDRLDVVKEETMNRKKDVEREEDDEEDFMREVESDKDMRMQMNVYKSNLFKNNNLLKPIPKDATNNNDDDEDDDDDDQKVALDELLDNLALDDAPDHDHNVTMSQAFDDDIMPTFYEEGERAAKDGISYVGKEDSRQVMMKEAATTVKEGAFGKEFLGKDFKFI